MMPRWARSPAGITFSEWALSNPSAWAYLAPIVTENDGWALFITTARGRNHAKSMLDMAQSRDDWFSEVLPVNVTSAMSEDAVEQQRLEYTGIFGKEAADALIDQEYYCSFEAAILGAYWGKEMLLAEQQGRICDVPVNTDLPVHTAWDIGVDDAMAIWCFQVYPDHLDIVDYYEGHGQGFDHYCAWLDKRGYHGTDWMPHDAKVREAGAPGARTRIETLFTLGRKPELAPEQSLMDGINAGRKTIPFARFDGSAARRASSACDPTAPSGTRRLGPSRRRPTTTGPHTAPMAGGICRCPGARRCASRRRRRCLSAYPCRTSPWISSWTSKTAGRRGRTGSRPWRNEGRSVGPRLTLSHKDQSQQLDMATVWSL